jgi:hypothetical protein
MAGTKSKGQDALKGSSDVLKGMYPKDADQDHLLKSIIHNKKDNALLEIEQMALDIQGSKNFFKLMDDIEAETAQ